MVRFFQQIEPLKAYLSVLTLGELRKGIAQQEIRQADSTRRLELWLRQLEADFIERIIPLELATAYVWGELSCRRTLPVIDSLLAATALHHGLTLVTRNTRDIEDTGVIFYNPWDDADLDEPPLR